MLKTLTLVGIGVCILASQAVAGNPTQTTSTVALASSSGLFVRVTPAQAVTVLPASNLCASAINTHGVTRATTAVKTGGRVFLVGSNRSPAFATVPARKVLRPKAEVQPVRKAPQGLGVLLAKVFGIHPKKS